MIDCDEAVLLCAARDERELTEDEQRELSVHLLGCELCREQAREEDEGDSEWLWLSRIPLSEFDGERPRADQAVSGDRSMRSVAHEPTVAAVGSTIVGVESGIDAQQMGDDERGTTSARGLGDMRGLPIIDPGVYEWGPTIGRGGMGRVVAARDRRLGRRVAIKELLFDHMAARFENEARITARLQHPAIVHVHEAGRWPTGEPFYAMKLVEGKTLADEIRARPEFSERAELLSHVISIVGAIAYAHEQGVVHRDLKPSNIVVGAFGETVVIDWGLATDAAGQGDDDVATEGAGEPYRQAGNNDTMAGAGTLQYMPLEQAKGARPDPGFDVYALGATLYHVISGRAPYGHGRTAELFHKLVDGPPAELAALAPDAPADLLAIVAKAMHRDPARRYATAKELAEDLDRYQSGQLVSAHDYSLWTLLSRFVARHRAVVATVAMLLVVTGAMATISVREIISSRDRAVAQHAAMLAERGRQEVIDGHDMRALPFLRAAYERVPTDSLRLLLGQAMSSADAHEATINTEIIDTIAISPAGDRVAYASPDGLVSVVKPQTTTHVKEGDVMEGGMWLPGHHSEVTMLAWSPDGTMLATAGMDNMVNVWNMDTGESRYRFGDHGHAVRGVAFSTDGTTLVTWGDDRTVRYWRAATGESLDVFRAPADRRIAAVARSGEWALTVRDEAGQAELWTVRDASRESVRVKGMGAVERAVFSADGRLLAVYGDGAATIWRVSADNGAVERLVELPIERAALTSLAFSADGRTLLAGDEAGRVTLWDAAHGVCIDVWDGHRAAVTGVAFASNGPFAVSGSTDGFSRVWRLDKPNLSQVVAASAAIDASALVAENGYLSVSPDAVIQLRDARTGVQTVDFAGHRCEDEWCEPERAISSMSVSRSGDLMVSTGVDATTRVWNARSGELLHTREQFVLGAKLSPDAQRVASVHGREVAVWSARTGADEMILSGHTDRVTSVHFSNDGSRLLTTGRDGSVRLWDTSDGSEAAVLGGHNGAIEYAAVAANDLAATAGTDRYVRVWNLQTGERVHAITAHAGRINQVTFNRSGTLLASASDDGSAKIWSLDSGLLRSAFRDRGAPVRTLALSPDGQFLVTGGGDGVVRIWDVSRATLLVRLPARSGEIRSVTFTGDGSGVIATAADGAAQVWPLPIERRAERVIAEVADPHATYSLREDRLLPMYPVLARMSRGEHLPRPERHLILDGDELVGARVAPALQLAQNHPGASLYGSAWQHFDTGAWTRAYQSLRAAAEAGAPAEILAELGLFAGRAQIEPDAAVADIRGLSSDNGAVARAIHALVRSYYRAGSWTAAWSVSDQLVSTAPPSVLIDAFQQRSQLAHAQMDAERAVEELNAGYRAALDADSPRAEALLTELASLAKQYHRLYTFTFRDRYGRAGLAAYDAYLAVPERRAGAGGTDMATFAEWLRTEVTLEKMTGTQEPRSLRHSIRQRLPHIAECYERSLQTWPDLAGTLSVSLYIDNNGEVTDSWLSPQPGADGLAAVSQCVKDSVTSWQLPKPQHSPTVLVDYQVSLTPESVEGPESTATPWPPQAALDRAIR